MFEVRKDGTTWFVDGAHQEQIPPEDVARRYMEAMKDCQPAEDQRVKLAERLAELTKGGPIQLGSRFGGSSIDV